MSADFQSPRSSKSGPSAVQGDPCAAQLSEGLARFESLSPTDREAFLKFFNATEAQLRSGEKRYLLAGLDEMVQDGKIAVLGPICIDLAISAHSNIAGRRARGSSPEAKQARNSVYALISKFVDLQHLRIPPEGIAPRSLEFLRPLVNLARLECGGPHIKSLTGIEACPLRHLEVWGSPLSDFSTIGQLKELELLDLTDSGPRIDLAFLRGHPSKALKKVIVPEEVLGDPLNQAVVSELRHRGVVVVVPLRGGLS